MVRKAALALLCAALAAGSAVSASAPAAGKGPTHGLLLEVLGIGLEGYVHYDGPCLIRYRITNKGPARDVVLGVSLMSTATGAVQVQALQITGGYADVHQNLRLKAGEVRTGQWILPVLREPYDPDQRLVLEAKDAQGRELARAPMPRSNTSNPVVVLAEDQEAVIPIRNAVLWRSGTEDPWEAPPEVALVLSDLPRAWYVYRPARLVILARSLTGLAKEERTALEQWIAFGGTLVIVPQLCNDWQLENLGDLTTDPVAGASYGAGRVMLAPPSAAGEAKRGVEEKTLRDWLSLTGLLRGYYDMTMPGIAYGAAPLTQSYSMPSTLVLVIFILGIIVLVGPVVHLLLARMRRREWAWAAVPILSLVLALGTYGLSTGIKGEGTVLEFHHVLKSYAGTDHAPLFTYTRVLASDRVQASLSFSADHPLILTPSLYPDPFSSTSRAVPRVLPDSLSLSGLGMPRWSYEDFTFLSSSRAVPLDMDTDAQGVKVTNTSGLELRDLIVWTGEGWHAVKPRFTKGEKVTVPWSGGAIAADMLKPAWMTEDAMKSMAGLLASPWPGSNDRRVVVAAHCSPRGLPHVNLQPAPEKVLTDVTCLWLWKSGTPSFIPGGVR